MTGSFESTASIYYTIYTLKLKGMLNTIAERGLVPNIQSLI